MIPSPNRVVWENPELEQYIQLPLRDSCFELAALVDSVLACLKEGWQVLRDSDLLPNKNSFRCKTVPLTPCRIDRV